MRGRLAIAFPYIIVGIILGLIVFDNLGRPAASTVALAERGLRDPVCNMDVNPAWPHRTDHAGEHFIFCSTRCLDLFVAQPQTYLGAQCVVCSTALTDASLWTATYQGQAYAACSEEHRTAFLTDPAGYFLHHMWGIPPTLYYASIGGVLVVSFIGLEWRSRRQRPAAPLTVQLPAAARNGNGVTHHACTPALALAGASGGTGLAPPPPAPPDLTFQIVDPAFVEQEGPAPPAPRIDLLRVVPGLARALRWPPMRFVAQATTGVLFIVIIAAGLFGNQSPALNIAPLLTWTIWWAGLVVLIMFAGKAWCYVCPWDAFAGWLERGRLWGAGEGMSLRLRLPRMLRTIWPATILFILLTWIELGWGVTMRPRVTAYMALAMFALAFVCALVFDRKTFCRYGCLVGRISGLYALFGGLEVRARDTGVCKRCPTKDCYHGNERGDGCPTFEFLGAMDLNTYCIMCGECIKTCPEDNVALNLRPWGTDLLKRGRPRSDEAYLALFMLAITALHGLTMTERWTTLTERLTTATALPAWAGFSIGMTAILVGPILIYAALTGLSWWLSGDRATSYMTYFTRYAYALLPIALFYHLAHNAEHLVMEGPKILRLLSDPFGWGWNIFGTAFWATPPLMSLHTLWYAQVGLVLIGHVYSLWVADHAARNMFSTRAAAFRSQLPMLAGMVLFSVFSLWLLKQPMLMRTSAM